MRKVLSKVRYSGRWFKIARVEGEYAQREYEVARVYEAIVAHHANPGPDITVCSTFSEAIKVLRQKLEQARTELAFLQAAGHFRRTRPPRVGILISQLRNGFDCEKKPRKGTNRWFRRAKQSCDKTVAAENRRIYPKEFK